MTVRIGINGLGRIGRDCLRAAHERPGDIEIVAVNDLADAATLAHLLRYDSTFGPWRREITATPDSIGIDGNTVRVFGEREPAGLPWRELGVDIVVEATGRFRDRESAAAHLAGGARKVVLTSPGKKVDATIVIGVNDDVYQPAEHHIVSNASCTTNCLAPMVMVLDDTFGVNRGLMTTIHSYTNDQSLLDGPHKDLRRARGAAVNMIPTSTGAATAVGLVLPRLRGKLSGVAVRVPVEDVSLTDLTVELARPASREEVNAAFAEAADGRLKGILRYTTDPIVSRDVLGDPASCVLDASLTSVDGQLAKVFGWYDNEWGYAQRTLDLVELVAARL